MASASLLFAAVGQPLNLAAAASKAAALKVSFLL
jgi:hypothetical protein